MSQFKTIIILFAVFLAITSARSAPTDSEAVTKPMDSTDGSTTSTTPAPKSETSSETPSMAVSAAQDPAHLSNTTFTCYNRKVGYYADVESSCKVYHFCMLGDYNGQEVYQRISYLCLNDTLFDQQILDCVEGSKISAPCSESAKFYEDSNAVLRKAIIGKLENEKGEATPATDSSSTTTTTTPASSSNEIV